MRFKTFIEQTWKGFERQKMFPFMYNTEQGPWQRTPNTHIGNDLNKYGEMPYRPEAFYHVTRDLRGVIRQQKLLSRSQLGDKVMGLSGFTSYENPHTVSLTYNLSRAREIYDAFKLVAQIVSGRVTASQIYDYLNPDNFDDFDQLTAPEQVVAHYVPKKYIRNGDTEKIKAILDKKIRTPEERYDFFRDMEGAVEQEESGQENDEYVRVQSVIGFSAPFEQMKTLDPRNIAIIQCVVRKHADVTHLPGEAEVRVPPEDLQIVRYLQP